jgi:aspartate/methionine/tyrosine aminotransferase
MTPPVHAPYMVWAKSRPAPRFDLAISNVLGCAIDDLPGARDALSLQGTNENGYPPLVEAIAGAYGLPSTGVATAVGASGANFLVFAALLDAGDDVIIERPCYDPLIGAVRLLGANVVRVERDPERRFALAPDAVARVVTPRTRLIVLTSPHNPSGTPIERAVLDEVGRIAESAGARVLVDEVYLDVLGGAALPAATIGPAFISSSSLTKSYGLAGLRCGWTLSAPDVAERIRRVRDVVDGTGSIVTDRLAVLAFAHRDQLAARARTLLDANAALLRTFLASRPELDVDEPHGGTVIFPRLRGVHDTERFASRLLAERQTAVVPGRFFEAPAHVRIGYGGRTEDLAGGLAALGEALGARAW